jgi:hypothetical protein
VIDATNDNDISTTESLFEALIAGAANRPPPTQANRDRFRLQRGAQHLVQRGPSALAEFLAEIGNDFRCLGNILDRLDAWTRLTPETVAMAGGDRFSSSLTVVAP